MQGSASESIEANLVTSDNEIQRMLVCHLTIKKLFYTRHVFDEYFGNLGCTESHVFFVSRNG